jgi:photosystem II stability/assembly factor-like uncharacterized protein
VAPVTYTAASWVGPAGAGVWAGSAVGLYLTEDGGTSWKTITPAILNGVDPGYRIGPMVGIGTQDLWLPVEDVPGLMEDEPGLIPPGSASTRGSGIERSSDGGRTWQFTALPGCVQLCGANISLSFPDPEHGFASIGPGPRGTTALFSTSDGGVTWRPVAHLPGTSGSRIVFADASDGWAVNALVFVGGGGEDGSLSRTTDGGVTWQRPAGLPSTDLYEPPLFFGSDDGVVLGRPERGAPGHQPTVFTTADGGARWTAHVTPPDPSTKAWTGAGDAIPFSAPSPAVWMLFVGPRLYVTTDAGRTWTKSRPEPTWRPDEVSTMFMTSPRHGWTVATKPGCPDQYPMTTAEGEACYPVLMASTDAGGQWTPRNP